MSLYCPWVGFSPSTGSYKTAGDGANMYVVVSPVANTIATNIVANIALFVLFIIYMRRRGNLIVPPSLS